MKQLRRLHKRIRASRATSGLLCLALALLHPLPESKLYHCLVTGRLLEECCCRVLSSCCDIAEPEPPPCCELSSAALRSVGLRSAGRGDGRGSGTPQPAATVGAACSCCDVIRRDSSRPPKLIASSDEGAFPERAAHALSLPVEGPLVGLAQPATRTPAVSRSRPAPTTVSRYILHETFLL